MSGKSVIVRPPREIKVWKSACGLSLSQAQMLSHGIGSLSLAASRCSFERGVGKGQRGGVASTMWINIYKLKTHTHSDACAFSFLIGDILCLERPLPDSLSLAAAASRESRRKRDARKLTVPKRLHRAPKKPRPPQPLHQQQTASAPESASQLSSLNQIKFWSHHWGANANEIRAFVFLLTRLK